MVIPRFGRRDGDAAHQGASDVVHPASNDALAAFSDTAVRTLRRMMLTVIIALIVGTIYSIYTGNNELVWFGTTLAGIVVGVCYREIRLGRIERGLGISVGDFGRTRACYRFWWPESKHRYWWLRRA